MMSDFQKRQEIASLGLCAYCNSHAKDVYYENDSPLVQVCESHKNGPPRLTGSYLELADYIENIRIGIKMITDPPDEIWLMNA